MSRYNNEDDNLAQQIEGFACGYDKMDDQYMLTPEETEKDSELDDNIYNETEEGPTNQPLIASESEAEAQPAAPSSEPVKIAVKKSGFCIFTYLTNPDNRIRILFSLVALAVLVYVLHAQGMFTLPTGLPSLSSGIANPFDSATSSFSGSTSLGKNVANMARTFN